MSVVFLLRWVSRGIDVLADLVEFIGEPSWGQLFVIGAVYVGFRLLFGWTPQIAWL